MGILRWEKKEVCECWLEKPFVQTTTPKVEVSSLHKKARFHLLPPRPLQLPHVTGVLAQGGRRTVASTVGRNTTECFRAFFGRRDTIPRRSIPCDYCKSPFSPALHSSNLALYTYYGTMILALTAGKIMDPDSRPTCRDDTVATMAKSSSRTSCCQLPGGFSLTRSE